MQFKTNAAIQGDAYGKWQYNADTQTYDFVPLGKLVTVESVTTNIETRVATLLLSFDYMGETQYCEVPRKAIGDNTIIQELAESGADVTKKNLDIVVDTIRLQENALEADGHRAKKVYTHLGWKSMPIYDYDGTIIGTNLCYRAHTMIGPYHATYVGNLKVAPMGSFAKWAEMVRNDIIGHIPMEIVLLAALSAVVNDLISSLTTGENPIVSLCGVSGSGKSSIAFAAVATAGMPFDGEIRTMDERGSPVSYQSVLGSWSATENATITSCAGNRGSVVVLNELGKFKGKDMTRIVYDFAEGSDKKRLNANLETTVSEGYSTTIISIGEHSLLSKCVSKADGIRVRVLEIEDKMTSSAAQADRIKDISRKHNGHAAPMLAEYIINNGGIKPVLALFNRYCEELSKIWPDTPSKERFIAKFPALFLTTADLAEQALGITFSKEAITEWFIARENSCSNDRNSAACSYDVVIETCRINSHRFFIRNDKTFTGGRTEYDSENVPRNEVWGRITHKYEKFDANRYIVEEFEVRKSIVEDILEKKGFANIDTCIAAWKSMDVLDYEDNAHPHRKRKLDPNAAKGSYEYVFVFRVFGDPKAEDLSETAKSKPRANLARIPTLTRATSTPPPLPNSNRDFLLSEDEEVNDE